MTTNDFKLFRVSSSRVAFVGLAVFLVAGVAFAEPEATGDLEQERRYPWNFHEFDSLDYAITGLAAAGYLAVEFGVDTPSHARWSSTTVVDDEVRGWLRAQSREGRERADFASDILWYVPLAMPWMELAFPLFGDRWNWDTAWNMAAINLQAFAISGFLTRSGHRLVARERPDVSECEKDPEYSNGCFAGSYASYPSGHTSTASVGAGLVCAHHLKLGLLGNETADGLVCGASVSMAVGAGVMRLMADRHHATDVVTGAVVGFGSGLALPLIRHYREQDSSGSDGAKLRWTVVPTVQGADGLGLGAFGWF